MSAIRRFAKSCIVLVLGRESRPRKIVRGPASGYRIRVSPAENLGYLLGTHEPHLQKIIRDYVATGDTVFDIGANVGYVSLTLAKRVGDSGLVIAFEPVPGNVDSFRENIKINRLTNIQLLEFAASDRSGEAIIRVTENLSMASLAWHRNNPSAIEIPIKTVAIDELVESGNLGYPAFVKIDVEGAEGSVLKGMRHTIAAARPILFVECSETGRETAWFLLRGLGYRCQLADTRQWVKEFEDYHHSDFLWLPPDLPARSEFQKLDVG
jgi:FkbM family methyltransferase